MESLTCADFAALSTALSAFEFGYLFRGQTKHYAHPDGAPSLTTSFQRQGCIPPLMRKCSYYAHEVLCVASGSRQEFDTAKTQALLQHYGWRSFFIDVSANAAVAAWFGSHSFRHRTVLELAEDCHDDPALLAHDVADYPIRELSDIGHMYVFSLDALARVGVGAVDLTAIVDASGFRFAAQDAWLLGELTGPLPLQAVAAHIESPVAVLIEYAEHAGFGDDVRRLFPPRSEDPILASFLSLPWVLAGSDSLPVFRRGLPLPEYDFKAKKGHGPEEAFVTPFWVDTDRSQYESEWIKKLPFYRTVEQAQYQTNSDPAPIPHVRSLHDSSGGFVIELEGLIRHPELAKSFEYGKGVVVEHCDGGRIELSELIVEHPGRQRRGFGSSRGWTYRFDDTSCLHRAHSPNDCPCENTLRHERHFGLLLWLNDCLARNRVRRIADASFELDPN
ncbi:MAG: FRG domain-containing protein [Planctomycetota bacterium]